MQPRPLTSPARWMGLDLGLRWWGISLSDVHLRTARPLAVLDARDRAAAVRRIRTWIQAYAVQRMIVGIPLRNGAWTTAAERVFHLCGYLRRRLRGVEWRFVDETETTWNARLLTPPGRRDDAWAAALILQRGLEHPDTLWTWKDLLRLRAS